MNGNKTKARISRSGKFAKGKYLKLYFIYGNEKQYTKQKRVQELESLGRELKPEKLALTFVPAFADRESDVYPDEIDP